MVTVISINQGVCVSSRQIQTIVVSKQHECKQSLALILIEMTNTISSEFVSDAKWRRVIVFGARLDHLSSTTTYH